MGAERGDPIAVRGDERAQSILIGDPLGAIGVGAALKQRSGAPTAELERVIERMIERVSVRGRRKR